MAQMTITYVFSPNTVISSSQMNTNLVTDIRDTYNTHDTSVNGVHGVSAGAIVGTTMTQTLTNKTLTAPVIATIVNTGTLTLPTSTDTLVGRATTDTLTNKTLTSPIINGNVAFDTDTLYVDATNNRVGVGTTSPVHKFHVIGPSGVAIHLSNSDDSDRGGGITTSGAAGAGAVALNTSSAGYALTFGIDSVEKMRLGTSGVFIIGGQSASIDDDYLLQVYQDRPGDYIGSILKNTSNTSGSHAVHSIQVGGSSAGDPMLLLDINGAQTWYIAADNFDSDSFKIGTGSTVGSNVSLTLTTAGDASFGRDLLITRNLTVSGSILSPTITTPTIASFTNANHNHQDSAGGGALSTSAITSGTFADARIASSNVTQHQSSLTIAETQITDGSVLARVGSNETISGTWTFSNALTLSSGGAFSGTISGNPTFSDGVTFSDYIDCGYITGSYIELTDTSNSLLDLTMLDISGVNNHVSGYAYGITFSTTGGTLDSPFKFDSAYRSTSALGAYYGKIAVKIDGVAGVKYIPLYD